MLIAVVAMVIALGTVIYLGYPILRRDRSYAPDQVGGFAVTQELRAEKDTLLRAIKDLEFDLASGKLSPDDYGTLRGRYEARAMDVLQELDTLEATIRTQPQPATPPEQLVTAELKRSGSLWSRPVFATSVIGLLVVIIGGGGFLLGRVTQHAPLEGTLRDPGQGDGQAMIGALEARLNQNPHDVEALVGVCDTTTISTSNDFWFDTVITIKIRAM